MVRVSVVVPTLNEARALPALLKQLQAWQQPGDEILVVDGGSNDGTAALAQESCANVLRVNAGRSNQLNAGGHHARGDVIWFVHADSDIKHVSRTDIVSAIESGTQWGWCTVAIDDPALWFRVIERGMRWRSKLTRVATGDQGVFVQRGLFEQLGGFNPIELMEDVDFAKRARAIARPAVIAGTIATSARRWRRHGIMKTILLMWSLRLGWWLGVPTARLARAYQSR